MELLVIILNKVEYMSDVLQLLVEAEIVNATILDSEGIGHYLAYEVPVFAGLRTLIGDKNEHNKTILALVKKKKSLEEFKRLIKKEKIDFAKQGMGIMFTVPLKSVLTEKK